MIHSDVATALPQIGRKKMNRFRTAALLFAVVACITAIGLLPRSGVSAQDATPTPATVELRLAALEAEVAIQREVIASLLGRIKVLEDKLNDPQPAIIPTGTPEPNKQPISVATSAPTFEILEVDTRVTETNNVWWKYAWLLTLENKSSDLLALSAEIQFLDEDGFVVDDDFVPDMLLGAGETKTFRDYVLIDADAASKVDAINALVKVREQLPDPSFVPDSSTTTPNVTPTATPTVAMTVTNVIEPNLPGDIEATDSQPPITGTSPTCHLRLDTATGRTVYVVQAGDSSFEIARRCGVNLRALLDANDITNPDFIFSGQHLLIPLPTISETPTPVVAANAWPEDVEDIGIHIKSFEGIGNLNIEAVMVSNQSNLARNLQGWRLESSGGSGYTFGNVSLFPGGGIVLYSGDGTDTSVALYWERPTAVWRSGDFARLLTPSGETVSLAEVP